MWGRLQDLVSPIQSILGYGVAQQGSPHLNEVTFSEGGETYTLMEALMIGWAPKVECHGICEPISNPNRILHRES